MAAKVRIRPVQPGDTDVVLQQLRAADRAECLALGVDPVDGMLQSIALSVESWTCEVNGQPAGIFGLAMSADAATAAPWLLATDALPQAGMAVARRALRIVARWARVAPLENVCDARNLVAVRFLEWLGFTVDTPTSSVLVRFSLAQRGAGCV